MLRASAGAHTALPRLTLVSLRSMPRAVTTAARRAAKARPLELMPVSVNDDR